VNHDLGNFNPEQL